MDLNDFYFLIILAVSFSAIARCSLDSVLDRRSASGNTRFQDMANSFLTSF